MKASNHSAMSHLTSHLPGPRLYHVDPRADRAPRLFIRPDEANASPIRPRLFANFLEHLGFSIQGGVSAQLLLNPTFFTSPRWPNQNLPAADIALLRENGVIAERLHRLDEQQRQAYAGWRPHVRVTGFGLLVLDDDTAYGIPLPWKTTPHGAGTGAQPGRVGPSVSLQPGGGEAVLAQGFFPPARGRTGYEGHLWVKATGQGTLRVALRRRGPDAAGEDLAMSELTWPGERWTKIAFRLDLPAGSLRPLEPVDFCIVAAGSGRLWVDRALLLPADHVDGLDPDMLDAIRRLAPPALRWPGGNFTSTYHFWDGIGPLDQRQTVPNIDWGGFDDNFFGVNEFLRLCELVDTEPHLCVNIGNGTPEEAAAWVEYVNGPADSHWGARRAADGHPEPYDVRLWEVGNEIYGVWQTGHCGPEENARRYRVWAEAMLAVDPSLELLATGNSQDLLEPHHHWHEALLAEGGPHMHCIALHALPGNVPPNNPHIDLDALWRDLMAQPWRWEERDLPELLALARRLAPDREVDFAVTEWGILGDTQRPQVGNLGGAVWAALFLNMAIRCQEVIRVANATALLHGGCLRKAGPFLYEDPQVEVIRRYTQLGGGQRLPIIYQGPVYAATAAGDAEGADAATPWIDAVAVRPAAGKRAHDNEARDNEVVIALVNRHPAQAQTVTLELPAGQRCAPASFEVMTGHLRQMNTPLAPQRVVFAPQPLPAGGTQLTLTLPPRAIGWLRGQLA